MPDRKQDMDETNALTAGNRSIIVDPRNLVYIWYTLRIGLFLAFSTSK
jgi:hypothetical protein